MNKRLLLVMVALVTSAWAQDKSTVLTQVGCGPDQAKFEVKRDAHLHPTGTPPPARRWSMFLATLSWTTQSKSGA